MDFLVIGLIWAAMIATGVWESSSEGVRSWAKGKTGWKIGRQPWVLTQYHFFLFWVTFPLLLSIPLVLDYSAELLRTIAFAYITGVIIQDFSWFIFNKRWGLRRFNPKYVDWHAWIRVGPVDIPALYIIGAVVALIIAFV